MYPDSPVGPLKYPRYRVCVWYVSHVEKNIGRTGIRAVKAPILVEPYPTAAVSRRLASVQFKESMPWLCVTVSDVVWRVWLHFHILKQFTQRARRAGATRLLSVDVVHGGVPARALAQCLSARKRSVCLHPHAKGEAVVDP